MNLQEKRKKSANIAFALDMLHIVVGILIVIFPLCGYCSLGVYFVLGYVECERDGVRGGDFKVIPLAVKVILKFKLSLCGVR